MNDLKKESLKDTLSSILDIIICLLLFIMSMYKGGFYKADTAFSNLAISSIGVGVVVVKLIRNIKNNNEVNKSWIITLLDGFVLLFPICFLLPIVFNTAADLEGSITEFFTYLNFSIIYFITRSTKNRSYYINTIILIGAILAVLGIDELTTRSIEEAFSSMSINYLTESTGRLSATLQYANVTALLMLIASIFSIMRIIEHREEKEVISKYKVISYTFLTMLLNTCIILTSSRMAVILLAISYIAISAFCLITKKHRSIILNMVFSLLVSVLAVNKIEGFILAKEYIKVTYTYLLLLLFNILFHLGIFRLEKEVYRIKITKNSKKKILLAAVATLLIMTILIGSINTPLEITTVEDASITINRNIYTGFNIGQNDLFISLQKSQDADYDIYIHSVDKDFNKQKVISLKNMNQTDEKGLVKLNSTFNVPENVNNLRINIKVKQGTVKVNKFKINDESIKLSYIIVPDELVFKVRDTFMHDQNNILRYEYYADAIKLIKLSPIIGHGGEGFLARYQEVQESSYVSSEVHSSILQIGVETGIIGMIIFVAILTISIFAIIKGIKLLDERIYLFIFLIVLVSFIIMSVFDITLSYQLFVLILAIILGTSASYYFENFKKQNKTIYKLDNKSRGALLDICVLSTALLITVFSTYYALNIYKASMVSISQKENIENEVQELYTKISVYEKKLTLDRYNVDNALKLNKLYDEHVKLLNDIMLTEQDEENSKLLDKEVTEYIIRQKLLIDNLIEYDYYDKYVLNEAANCYFNNFINYSKIYEKNFKTREVAYAFYLAYALKLTDRILEVGPNNKVANDMADNIYNTYYNSLKKKNTYLKSEVIESVVKDLKIRVDERK